MTEKKILYVMSVIEKHLTIIIMLMRSLERNYVKNVVMIEEGEHEGSIL